MSNGSVETQEIGSQIKVSIDGKIINADLGETLLEAARRNGIYIPSLCYHEDLCVSGSCRLCIVEFEETGAVQTACTYPITQSIKVLTSTPKIRQARRDIISLILRDHRAECTSCVRNGNCELQRLAVEYGVADYSFGKNEKPKRKVFDFGPIVRDMDKCIQCFRCVRTCQELQNVGALGKIGRGDDVRVSTFMDYSMMESLCVGCGQCINRCPVGALTERDDISKVWDAIEDPLKHVVIQTAPAPRAAIGECFGLEPGNCVTKELNTALKRMGFDKVFDTNFTADLTIMEEGTELLLRLKKALLDKEPVALPQMTSCSPGWIKFIEQVNPELLDHISSCKSPQQMFGAVIKTYYAQLNDLDPSEIVTVSLMPCTAKKYECERPEMGDSGFKDVDIVLTTRELARMIKQANIDLPKLEPSEFDEPLGLGTGAGQIFGATGGVMEAAIRTAYEIVTGHEVPFEKLRIEPVRGMEGIRQAELPIAEAVEDWKFLEGATLKVMVVHGLSNARIIVDKLAAGELSDVHFIEIMACPGGCLGGGGQPIPTTPEIREARAKAIYKEEESMTFRKSHDNPTIPRIYQEFLTDGPCGHKSHKLLHTHYTPRGSRIV